MQLLLESLLLLAPFFSDNLALVPVLGFWLNVAARCPDTILEFLGSIGIVPEGRSSPEVGVDLGSLVGE